MKRNIHKWTAEWRVLFSGVIQAPGEAQPRFIYHLFYHKACARHLHMFYLCNSTANQLFGFEIVNDKTIWTSLLKH